MTCWLCCKMLGFGELLVYLDAEDATYKPRLAHPHCVQRVFRSLSLQRGSAAMAFRQPEENGR